MKIVVFVRGTESSTKEFLEKMMNAAKIEDWELKDVLVEDLSKLDTIEIGIAMGKICGRVVEQYTNRLFVLPTEKQLQPSPQNSKNRTDAWNALLRIKDFLDTGNIEDETQWQYATVHLPGQKKIIIYEDKKPTGIDGDIFISRDDSNTLLKIKEAFKADAVIIR